MIRVSPLLLCALLLAACGTDVSGPSAVLLSCVLREPASLAPGGVVQLRGEENRQACLTPDGAASGVFTFIPFFGAPPEDEDDEPRDPVSLELWGAGLVTPTAAGAPAAALTTTEAVLLLDRGATGAGLDPGPARDWEYHNRLRHREIRELTPLIRPGGGPSPTVRSRTAAGATGGLAADVPAVGEILDFNVAVSCTGEDIRSGEVVYVSDHAVVVADTANPADLAGEDYAYFAVTFDTLIRPVETAHFGEPTDIDGNGRSILFFTTAVNERNPHTATSVVLGFFWSGDLFPEQATQRLNACPASNQAEMFYLIAPDPDGRAGRAITLEQVRQRAIPLIGHEYQHLVNASRRLHVNEAFELEEVWLNEGLSHAAEELLFFAASPLEPLQNLTADDVRGAAGGVDAFNEFMAGNLRNFRFYLEQPDTASLMADNDELSTRGAAWAFLRYAADRSGEGDESFFFSVVNSRTAGLENLEGVLDGAAPLDWMRDWTVSVYADDFVDGIDPRFQLLSWDLRAIYQGTQLGEYPLSVGTLGPDRTTRIELKPGGADYLRFGIPTGERAVISAESDGGAPPATLRGSFIREQ